MTDAPKSDTIKTGTGGGPYVGAIKSALAAPEPRSQTINAVFRGIAGLILLLSVPVLLILKLPVPPELLVISGTPIGWFARGVGK